MSPRAQLPASTLDLFTAAFALRTRVAWIRHLLGSVRAEDAGAFQVDAAKFPLARKLNVPFTWFLRSLFVRQLGDDSTEGEQGGYTLMTFVHPFRSDEVIAAFYRPRLDCPKFEDQVESLTLDDGDEMAAPAAPAPASSTKGKPVKRANGQRKPKRHITFGMALALLAISAWNRDLLEALVQGNYGIPSSAEFAKFTSTFHVSLSFLVLMYSHPHGVTAVPAMIDYLISLGWKLDRSKHPYCIAYYAGYAESVDLFSILVTKYDAPYVRVAHSPCRQLLRDHAVMLARDGQFGPMETLSRLGAFDDYSAALEAIAVRNAKGDDAGAAFVKKNIIAAPNVIPKSMDDMSVD
ncbi:hypothetical protein H9P43_009354 [Blastocladiella emersonii ATCC 22665]|nr:hypothetical protein H9P43_009354 [Blastocladiella emersonii ATCC 22665]